MVRGPVPVEPVWTPVAFGGHLLNHRERQREREKEREKERERERERERPHVSAELNMA